MKKVMMGIVASLIVVSGGNAYADGELREQYAFTISGTCIQAVDIDDMTLAITGPISIRGRVLRGVFEYDGEGGGSAEFNFANVLDSGTVNGGPTSCDLENVMVNEDGSFTQDLVNCSGTVVFGAGAGQTFTISTSTQKGQVSLGDRRTIIVSVDEPNIETLTINSVTIRERICFLSGTGISRDTEEED